MAPSGKCGRYYTVAPPGKCSGYYMVPPPGKYGGYYTVAQLDEARKCETAE